MSNKERAIQLLDSVPEIKIECVIAYMQGIIAGSEEVEEPNPETIEAMRELENGGGEVFRGSAHDFISSMLEN